MRFTDKRGAIAITIMPVMTVILLLTATFVGMGHVEFLVLSAITGGFLIGGHFGMHSICGIFYPSAYRANGAGWATSIAKVGSVAGPILGGIVLPPACLYATSLRCWRCVRRCSPSAFIWSGDASPHPGQGSAGEPSEATVLQPQRRAAWP